MLVSEYQLPVTPAQRAASEEAIRTTPCSRTSCLRVWRDERGVGANDLQLACRRLAHAVAFVAFVARPAISQRPGPPGHRCIVYVPQHGEFLTSCALLAPG